MDRQRCVALVESLLPNSGEYIEHLTIIQQLLDKPDSRTFVLENAKQLKKSRQWVAEQIVGTFSKAIADTPRFRERFTRKRIRGYWAYSKRK